MIYLYVNKAIVLTVIGDGDDGGGGEGQQEVKDGGQG